MGSCSGCTLVALLRRGYRFHPAAIRQYFFIRLLPNYHYLISKTVPLCIADWLSRGGGVAQTNPYLQVAVAVDKHIDYSLLAINPNKKIIIIMGDLIDNKPMPV